MSNVYAQIGSSFQQVGGECPDGFITMSSQRPGADYVAADGGTWIKLVGVPQFCTRRQGRLALLSVGKLEQVEAYLSSIEDPVQRMAAQVEYEADTWERSNPLLRQLWEMLGGTEAELDALFTLAVTL